MLEDKTTTKLPGPEPAHHSQVDLDQYGFIRMVYYGMLDKATGLDLVNYAQAIAADLQKQHKAVNILADTRYMTGHTDDAAESGIAAREMLPYDKLAIVMPKTKPKTEKISRKITAISTRRAEIAYFTSEPAAVRWLQTDKP